MTDHTPPRIPAPRGRAPFRVRAHLIVLAMLGTLAASACGGEQSALDPAGPAAARLEDLWWLMFWLSAVIFIIVVALLVYALFRRRTASDAPPTARVDDRWGAKWIFLGGVVIPTIILVGLFVVTMFTLAAVDPRSADADLFIEVRGERWWWHVTYHGDDLDDPSDIIISANELRIPVGRRVQVLLRSGDVIHSFWVPSLQGKMDLMPGKTTHTWILADRPGRFRGQCAEYCGLQHTHMAFYVVAMPEEEFRAWYADQLLPAEPPADSLAIIGAAAFLTNGCAVCHTIRGTPAAGATGPDLTHVGSRTSLAAGMIPNTLGHMTGWIANPQQIKPGNFMPAVPLSPVELRAIAHYLQSLR